MASLVHVAFGQIVNFDTKITMADNGKKTTERTLLIQINSKEENWLSHIELNHSPNQEFKLNYARILDLKGNITRKLKKKEFITRNDLSYQAFYQDDLITEFDLYWSEYPYRVEYSYTIKEEEFLYLAWWTPLVYTNVSTIDALLEVNMPADYPIRFSASEQLNLKESKLEGRKILRWKSSMTKSESRNEIYSPPLDFPTVKIVPGEFKYGVIGKSDSWSSFGNWADELNNGTDQITLQEKWTLEKLIAGINNRNEIIKSIYYYLQDQTKYVNVAIDVGGLKSYPASYVCENKYGDCKALTTYMKAMLKSVGIASFYTIIKAGEENTEIDPNFPSQQFDHVILMIPSETDTLWLENTSSALPFNYLGTFTQNRYALAVNGEKSQLVKTPSLSIDDVLLERSYHFQATDNNAVQVDLDLTLRGNEFEDFRSFISDNDEDRQKGEVRRQNGVKDFHFDSWNIADFHRDSTFLQVKVEGTSLSEIRQIGALQVINPLRIVLPDFEKPKDRKLDVAINYPINKSDKSIYNLQEFEQNDIQVPERINIKNRYGLYSADYSKNGNELIVMEKFTLFANKVPNDQYEDFYEFMDMIKIYKKETAIIIK
ncbi:MAG: DUF3857 domain-containing protein [Cyclobacteriaceae bacterium]